MYGFAFLMLGLANTVDAVISFNDSRDTAATRWSNFIGQVVMVNGALVLLWLSGPP